MTSSDPMALIAGLSLDQAVTLSAIAVIVIMAAAIYCVERFISRL